MRAKKYYNDTFGVVVEFHLNSNHTVYKKLHKRMCKEECQGPIDAAGTAFFSEGTFVIWTSSKLTGARRLAVLAHECLHVANRILDRAGHKGSLTDDETQAYLMTAILEKALSK